ncbi:MAG: 2-hydroxyglutaryl-CoA dehydratase [Actinobacteria bacterium]|nr:MAG: 2-hydroxyglutaryl-CoA dehydratase [Actinomycetota bacterium]
MQGHLGIDVGSVSTNLVVLNDKSDVVAWIYNRTEGKPIKAAQKSLHEIKEFLPDNLDISSVGATGSARYLAGVVVGADIVKNEITTHAVAAAHIVPDVRTVIEIGGQDSKIIILRNGIVLDFAMNTVCAAGTGSFLDHQASRLSIPIEEFGRYALKSENPAHIAGRCTVFAESDMIHKQQVGAQLEDIIYGLCQALSRNYLNNLAKGKDLEGPIVFQGGVAANLGIRKAFEQTLEQKINVPKYHHVMGAIGAAILAKESRPEKTKFKGFKSCKTDYLTSGFNCEGCSNSCEVVKVQVSKKTLACWGGRCGKWEEVGTK